MSNQSTPNLPAASTTATRTLLRDVLRNNSVVGRTARLPSIRSPRDLTLGSLTRKTYVPNIPVRKKVKSETKEQTNNSASVRKEADKKKQRQRIQHEYVQLPGVMFGDGISSSSQAKKSVTVETSPQSKTSNFKAKSLSGKKELKLKEEKNDGDDDDAYLSDHFVEDGDDDHGEQSFPIVIPMNLPFNDFFENQEPGKSESIEKSSKKFHNASKVKIEKPDIRINRAPSTVAEEKDDISSIEKLFSNVKLISEEPVLLLELPSVITVPSKENDLHDNESNLIETPLLSNLSSSHIGKLQILRNGCSRLIISDLVFNVLSDIQTSMSQELVSVQDETWAYHMTELGQVQHSLKFVPDIEGILRSNK